MSYQLLQAAKKLSSQRGNRMAMDDEWVSMVWGKTKYAIQIFAWIGLPLKLPRRSASRLFIAVRLSTPH